MKSYKIELEEDGQKRELLVTPLGKEDKSSKNSIETFDITENGKELGQLVFEKGKYHYKGDEEFSADDINLIALSITSNQKELIIDSEEDDLDDEEEI